MCITNYFISMIFNNLLFNKENHKNNVLQMVWIHCEGENPVDKEFINDIKYYPFQGFPAYYYPYLNTPGYLAPLVAVEFVKPKCK